MTEACHVSKHQRGRPAVTTGWWGIKCIWHNWFLWWCHDRTSSTDIASLHWYSTLFEEHRPCFLVALLSALISKDATKASAHTTVQEHVTSRSFWMWPEAVLYVHSAFGSSCKYTAFIVAPLQRRVPVRCLYHYSQERLHGGLLSCYS